MIYAKHEKTGILGLLPYRSSYRLRAHGDKAGALAAQRVYRFKKSGESGSVWLALIEQAAADLGCTAIWTIPPHDPADTSNLQRLFENPSIRRLTATAPRKYGHRADVDVASLAFPPAPDGRVLVVDDVATTGATLAAVRAHLEALGIEAVCLALGMNWKMLPSGFDTDVLADQWEAAAEALHEAVDYGLNKLKKRSEANTLTIRPVENPARRARLEADPEKWLRHYLPAAFPLPFGDVHRDIIRAAARAIKTGSGMAVAAPRGTGKSTVIWGMALWAILSGACRFPVVAGWSHKAGRGMLRKWLQTLADNPALSADYPAAVMPFETSQHANRLKALAWQDGSPCGADVRITDGALLLPSGLGALAAVSVSGNTRGLNIGLADGSTIRPDVLLLDDPQDSKTAESPAMTKDTIEKIEGDLFSLSGPASRLSVMVACTIISENDVAAYFLEHPDFEAVRVAQIASWPSGWEDENSPVRALWDAWNKARLAGLDDKDGGTAARRFYKANKPELTAGMAVSWAQRYDRKRKDPDALYAAMLDFYRLGERAFMAERQNAPLKSGEGAVFDLPQAHVARRCNGLERRTAPDNTVAIVGMADINADAVRWALVAASNERALSVVDYGAYPGGGRLLIPANESEAPALMRGLSGLDAHLASLVITKAGNETPLPIDLMLLDAGGSWMQTVFDWLAAIRRTSRIPWQASRGWSSRNYRPNRNAVGRPGDGYHLADWPGKGRVIVHNSDLWRHRQQKAWFLPIGAPDSIAFYGGERTRHDVFADGVIAERLVAYAETEHGPLYKWQLTPGLRNDFGDVATGLFVAAARVGLTPTGAQQHRPATPRNARRAVRHINI